ncbi:MAG: hydrogenase maturation nickel metallochaperone HypA [Candidatus Geothermincolia bacterium]
MHEMAVTESILSICLKHAEANHATRIRKVNLVVGELAGIVDQSVSFYWEMLAKETIATGAELVFRRTEVRASCAACGKDFKVKEFDLTCPECGEGGCELTSGREFRVESIEVE